MLMNPGLAPATAYAEPFPVVEDPGISAWRRRGIAAAAIISVGFAGAGCTPGNEGARVGVDPLDNAAATASVALSTLSGDLLGTSPNVADAKNQQAKASNGDPKISESLSRALDAALARQVLRGSHSTSAQGYSDAADIQDIVTRDQVISAIYTNNVEATVSAANGENHDETQAELARLTADAPASAAHLEADAQIAADCGYASDLIDDIYYEKFDLATLQEKLKVVTDPKLRNAALLGAYNVFAAVTLQNFYYDKVDYATATRQINTVPNGAIRVQALAALRIAKNEYDASEADYVASGLRLTGVTIQTTLSENYAAAFENDEQAANNLGIDLYSQASKAVDEAKTQLGADFAAQAHITPTPLTEIAPLGNLGADITLGNVVAKEKIKNVDTLATANDDADTAPKVFKQFGAIHLQNNSLELTLRDDANLTPAQRAAFQASYQRVKPLLEAAFARGSLLAVRFTLADDYNPYYDPNSREIIMQLDKNDYLSLDQLTGALLHETIHSIVRDKIDGLNIDEAQAKALNIACNNLVRQSYAHFSKDLVINPDILSNLRDSLDAKYQPIVDTMIKAQKTDNLTSLAPADDTLITHTDTPMTNRCNDVGSTKSWPTIWKDAETVAGVSIDADDSKTMSTNKAWLTFVVAWQDSVRQSSPFGAVINEANYADTQSEVKTLIGHSEDNDNEGTASAVDDLLMYLTLFKAEVAKLEPAEAKSVLDFMTIVASLVTTSAPSTKPLIATNLKLLGVKNTTLLG